MALLSTIAFAKWLQNGYKMVTKRLQFIASSRDKYIPGGQIKCVILIATSSGRFSPRCAASAANAAFWRLCFRGAASFFAEPNQRAIAPLLDAVAGDFSRRLLVG